MKIEKPLNLGSGWRNGELKLGLYNGSRFKIASLLIEVSIARLGIDNRKYVLEPKGLVYLHPYRSGEFASADTGIDSASVKDGGVPWITDGEIAWKIVEVKGRLALEK